MSTKEEYIARCMAEGDERKDAENTWELMEKIEVALKGDPWRAPELQYPPKVILARLFIEEYKRRTREGDKVFAHWLREIATGGAYVEYVNVIADLVEAGEHWKWWHTAADRK